MKINCLAYFHKRIMFAFSSPPPRFLFLRSKMRKVGGRNKAKQQEQKKPGNMPLKKNNQPHSLTIFLGFFGLTLELPLTSAVLCISVRRGFQDRAVHVQVPGTCG